MVSGMKSSGRATVPCHLNPSWSPNGVCPKKKGPPSFGGA